MTADEFPVIFVPGILGSTLTRTEDPTDVVWGDVRHTLKAFRDLATLDDTLQPGEVMERLLVSPLAFNVYGNFIRFLETDLHYERNVNLFLFAYDWRRNCQESALRLQSYVRKKRARLKRPEARFTIIAHSMGGLVARFCAQKPDMSEHISNIVTVGTPHHGSPYAWLALFEGVKLLSSRLARIDFLSQKAKTKSIVRAFPSVYQLLPSTNEYLRDNSGNSLTLSSPQSWGWLHDDHIQRVNDAVDSHRLLKSQVTSIPIWSICGNGQRTLETITVRRSHVGFDWRSRPQYNPPHNGDGLVLMNSAIFDSSKSCLVNARHENLLDNRSARDYMSKLLRGQIPGQSDHVRSETHKLSVEMNEESPYAPGAEARLRIGLKDADGKFVRDARFHVELFKYNDLGPGLTKFAGPEFVERDLVAPAAEPAYLAPYEFRIPHAPGWYKVVVTLRQPQFGVQMVEEQTFSVEEPAQE